MTTSVNWEFSGVTGSDSLTDGDLDFQPRTGKEPVRGAGSWLGRLETQEVRGRVQAGRIPAQRQKKSAWIQAI